MKPVPTVVALLACAGLVLIGTRSFHSETAKTRPVVLPFEVFWCGEDSDCAVVDRIGCCDCSQGGAQAAVTGWRRDDLRRFLKRACPSEQVCVQVDMCRSDTRAKCEGRRCILAVGRGDSRDVDLH